MAENNDLKTFSFRAEKEKVEYLDHLIDRKNVEQGPGSEGKISRSDLLRECIDDLIDELEEDLEGNGQPVKVAATTN
jgi:hypothetical protein